MYIYVTMNFICRTLHTLKMTSPTFVVCEGSWFSSVPGSSPQRDSLRGSHMFWLLALWFMKVFYMEYTYDLILTLWFVKVHGLCLFWVQAHKGLHYVAQTYVLIINSLICEGSFYGLYIWLSCNSMVFEGSWFLLVLGSMSQRDSFYALYI